MFAAFLDLYTQLPVMATFAASLGASATMSGVIVGAYSASNIFGNLFAGLLLDSLSRRRVVVVGMALTAAALFAYGFVESPPALLALRLAHGLAAGALTPGAFAMLGDRARTEHAKAMGASGAIIAVAAIVGFPLSALIRETLGYEWVFRASGLVMLCAIAAFALLARDAEAAQSSERGARTAQDAAPRSPLRDAVLGMVYAIVLAMTYCIGALIGHLPIAIDEAGLPPRWSGVAFAAFAIVAAVVMATPAQRAVDGRSRSLAIALGMALIGGSGAGLALAALGGGAAAYSLALMVAMMGAFGLGFGFVFPSLGAAVSERAGGGRRGIAFGVFYAIYSLGVFIGSSASGWTFDMFGASAPFAVSAAVAAIALPIAAALRKRE